MTRYSFFHRLLDLISPSSCSCCGNRLAQQECFICLSCLRHLPYTQHINNLYENELTKLFWRRAPIERAAALYYHQPHTESAKIIYSIKYGNRHELGEYMGRMMADMFTRSGLFESVTGIIPVPLARKRERSRGYNQSYQLAKGIADITHIPIYNKVLKRTSFTKSQTLLSQSERHDNVEGAFELVKNVDLSHEHILLIDDVVTTGATLCTCIQTLMKANARQFSVASLCFTKV